MLRPFWIWSSSWAPCCDQVRKILKRFQLGQIVLKTWAFSSPIFMMMVCMVLFLSGFKSFDLYFPIPAYVAWKAGFNLSRPRVGRLWPRCLVPRRMNFQSLCALTLIRCDSAERTTTIYILCYRALGEIDTNAFSILLSKKLALSLIMIYVTHSRETAAHSPNPTLFLNLRRITRA